MLDIAAFLTLLVLAIRAFAGLRRESSVRHEFGQSGSLEALVLLYPVAPIALLLGSLALPRVLILVLAGAFFTAALLAASKQNSALERSGTDRVKSALSAT